MSNTSTNTNSALVRPFIGAAVEFAGSADFVNGNGPALLTPTVRVNGTERQLAEAALHLDRGRFTPHVACIRMQGGRRAELERC